MGDVFDMCVVLPDNCPICSNHKIKRLVDKR